MGRSGTSLIQEAFAARDDFQVCGETGSLLFGIWENGHDAYMPLDRPFWDLANDRDALASYYVRKIFVSSFPSERREWFQKPIGLPFDRINLTRIGGKRSAATNFPVEWYWRVMEDLFPAGRFITTIRNPFDVAISRQEHTNWAPQRVLLDYVTMCEILEYRWERISHVGYFESLVADFRSYLESVCRAVGIVYQDSMMLVIATSHAAVETRSPKQTHRDKWQLLPRLVLSEIEFNCIQRLWDRVGVRLDVPASLNIVPNHDANSRYHYAFDPGLA